MSTMRGHRPRPGDHAAPAGGSRGALLHPDAGPFRRHAQSALLGDGGPQDRVRRHRRDTTDIAKILLLTEFALVYANDWCIVPSVAPVGSLTTVAGLLVTDVFGETAARPPAGRGIDEAWQNWRMFVLDTRAAGDVVEPRLSCRRRRRSRWRA